MALRENSAMTVRPRRSLLYMPGSNARAIEKGRTLAADGLILDLEDAVAPDAKESARRQVVDAVQVGGFGLREIFIRINGTDTPWGVDDLAAAAAAGPDAILVPKVARPEDIDAIGQRLAALAASSATRVWAMMETPLAVLNAREIAAAARNPATRLAGFVMGTNDLAKETRARIVPGRAPLVPWLMTVLAAARSRGLDIIDGVFNDLADTEGLARECQQAREMGFDGKTLIHPNQIGPCNAAFSPGPAEIDDARKIIAAFELPENRNKGAIRFDGRMIERLHADMARRVVAIADAISQSVRD
jgi:citrate lyase subunit beta / citryl-CoA lyase